MNRFQSVVFPRLVDLLYDAALDPTKWQAFLDELPANFGGANGVFYAFDKRSGISNFNFSFGIDPDFLASYVAYYAQRNPYAPGTLSLPLGKVVAATDAVSWDTLRQSEFYNDWMVPQGLPADHLGALVQQDGSSGTILALAPHVSAYSRGDRGIYERQLQMLLPHMTRAIEINRAASTAGLLTDCLEAVLDVFGAAALVVDGTLRVHMANAKAEALLNSERVISIDRHKSLHAPTNTANRAIAAAVFSAIRREPIAPLPIRLVSQSTGRVFIAWVVPLWPPGKEAPSVRHTLFAARGSDPGAIVLIVKADGAVAIPEQVIEVAFQLSRAEALLASALVAGQTIATYADHAGLSRNTVRNQLAAVFAKTGTRRQSELVGMVLTTLRPAAL
jgi:DNA-binding CsgD family transcriptional regulator